MYRRFIKNACSNFKKARHVEEFMFTRTWAEGLQTIMNAID